MSGDLTTIGLSEEGHRSLKELKERQYFAEMLDAYRFAIALALAHGASPSALEGGRQTIFNVGTLDPDGTIAVAVEELSLDSLAGTYRRAEGLAEWGIQEMGRAMRLGNLDLPGMLAQAAERVALTSDDAGSEDSPRAT